MKSFSKSTLENLKYYVYGLVDPRDGSIFYVGKASSNNRAFDHLKPFAGESSKRQRIEEIRRDTSLADPEPRVEILRYGLESEAAAFEVEAALIDALGLENLTNMQRGHGIERGRLRAEEVETIYGSAPIRASTISEPVMLFFVQNTYSPTLGEDELYDSVRQFWHQVSERTRTELTHRTALAIVDSVVVRVYSIAAWFPAGTTYSSRWDGNGGNDRWEFVGQILTDHPLLGKRLLDDNGEPIRATQKGYTYLPRA